MRAWRKRALAALLPSQVHVNGRLMVDSHVPQLQSILDRVHGLTAGQKIAGVVGTVVGAIQVGGASAHRPVALQVNMGVLILHMYVWHIYDTYAYMVGTYTVCTRGVCERCNPCKVTVHRPETGMIIVPTRNCIVGQTLCRPLIACRRRVYSV